MKTLIFLIITILIAHSTYSQTNGILVGTINDSTSTPIQHATVKITKVNQIKTSDERGNFRILNLPVGEYLLKISSVGFEPFQKKIQVVGSDTSRLDVILVASKPSFLNEIVITSRKREQLKEDLTSAVSIINTQSIQELQTVNNNASDILAVSVPGLGMSSGTISNWGQTLRGRQVLVLVDGAPQSTPLRNGSVDMRTIDPSVIERIEVIKGATSIYGNGASGGMINYITKNNTAYTRSFSSKTDFASTGSVRNSNNTLGGRIYQSFYGKLGKVDYSTSGSYEQTGVVKDADGDILGPTYGLSNNRVYNAFSKLGYQITANQRLQLSYNFFKSLEKNNLSEVLGSMKDGRKTIAVEGSTPGNDPGTRWNHNAQLKYNNNNLIGNTGLAASGYVQDVSTLFFYSTNFEGGGQSTIHSSKKGIRLDLHTPFSVGQSVTAELTYGADLLNDITSQPLLDGRSWVPKMNMVNVGPFAQLQASIFNDISVNGGLRYESSIYSLIYFYN